MTEEELKARKIKKKTDAYERLLKSGFHNKYAIERYEATLKAIDAIV